MAHSSLTVHGEPEGVSCPAAHTWVLGPHISPIRQVYCAEHSFPMPNPGCPPAPVVPVRVEPPPPPQPAHAASPSTAAAPIVFPMLPMTTSKQDADPRIGHARGMGHAAETRVRAALGFKAHTGWAAVVAVAGPKAAPVVVAKRRIEMAASFDEAAVYHAGRALPLADAEALLRAFEPKALRAAGEAIGALVGELRASGHDVVASAVVAGSAKPLPALDAILASHALVHTAEGELFRRTLGRASDALHVPASFVPAKDLERRAAAAIGIPQAALAGRLAAIGKASGKPWGQDQKESALAALCVL